MPCGACQFCCWVSPTAKQNIGESPLIAEGPWSVGRGVASFASVCQKSRGAFQFCCWVLSTAKKIFRRIATHRRESNHMRWYWNGAVSGGLLHRLLGVSWPMQDRMPANQVSNFPISAFCKMENPDFSNFHDFCFLQNGKSGFLFFAKWKIRISVFCKVENPDFDRKSGRN